VRRNLDLSSTLFAVASGPLPSAVAIVKISGPEAFPISKKIFDTRSAERVFKRERGMWVGTFHSTDGKRIDDGVLLSFVAPHSHTGEDSVELHCHGATAIVQRLQEELLKLGARPAERGEFSYRALHHGKLSATEIDTLGDLFHAKSAGDLSAIYSRRSEGLELEISSIRNQLIRALAILDTAVDFTDEYSEVVPRSIEPIQVAIHGCSVITQRYLSLKDASSPPRIALVGRPNAGKSSLFNRVLGRYRAIVHAEPGTTRDAVEERIVLGGRPWTLTDTAGVRTEVEGPEAEGIEIGSQFLESSDFWILMVDGTQGIGPVETDLLERHGSRPHAVIWNKRDLPEWKSPPATLGALPFSSVLSEDLGEFIAFFESRLMGISPTVEGPLPTAVACAKLEKVIVQLRQVVKGVEQETPPEYLSEEIRKVLRDLESVVGEVQVDDVLDRVFGEFCIGK